MDEQQQRRARDEWLWGWDPAPGIVSVWAERDGRALLWRRMPGGPVVREEVRYRPWALLADLGDLAHLGDRLVPEDVSAAGEVVPPPHVITWRELAGKGRLRYRVAAGDGRLLERAILDGARLRLGPEVTRLGDLGDGNVLSLPPDEQYLVATGRTSFCGLTFDDLHRLQFDLETTGLDANTARIFLVAVRDTRGLERVLDVAEGAARGLNEDAAEADLIARLAALIREADPDVIENHNLHGFDLPFLVRRAELLRVPLRLGREGAPGLRSRPASRGYGPTRGEAEATGGGGTGRGKQRYTIPGRECIDTLDAVRRHDFAARDLPGHGLKAVARHFGIAPDDREYVEGSRIYATWRADPERVRRYAQHDVIEVQRLAHLLGGAAFALAGMAPRRYERLADAGPATGILDPLLVRAYLRAGRALPAHAEGDGTSHSGAALYIFREGVARNVVKADVSSLYPSLMRQYRIGPASDELGALLALVDGLVEQRLAAKERAKTLPPGSPARQGDEAISAAMKILVNSAYGYMGAPGLTRFADVHAANEVTRRGRAVLDTLCAELAARGATPLEGDTDGVYAAVPEDWDEADERRLVAEIGTLLPPLVRLDFEGRYAAMLSHEPKNYALLGYDGVVRLRGVAFHSVRAEPYGEAFLRAAIAQLLRGDVPGVRETFVATVAALRAHEVPTAQVAARMRLTKSPEDYDKSGSARREAPYEALRRADANLREELWKVGRSISVYRAGDGRPALYVPHPDADDGVPDADDRRDYDAEHYVRLLRETFADRLACAFTPDDFDALFADPARPTLFAPPIASIAPVLTPRDAIPPAASLA